MKNEYGQIYNMLSFNSQKDAQDVGIKLKSQYLTSILHKQQKPKKKKIPIFIASHLSTDLIDEEEWTMWSLRINFYSYNKVIKAMAKWNPTLSTAGLSWLLLPS